MSTPMTPHLEIEKSWTIDAAAAVPALDHIDGISSVSEPLVFTLDATYFDTATFTLARCGITLRFRSGGADAGWHLKLPVKGDTRYEYQLPPSPAQELTVPEEFMQRLAALIGTAALAPIVEMHTIRREYTLFSNRGSAVAVFCDDQVSSLPRHPAVASHHWREWECELSVAETRKPSLPWLFEQVGTLVVQAGGQPPLHSSKLKIAIREVLAEYSELFPVQVRDTEPTGQLKKKKKKKKGESLVPKPAQQVLAAQVSPLLQAQAALLEQASTNHRTLGLLNVTLGRLLFLLQHYGSSSPEMISHLKQVIEATDAAVKAAQGHELLSHLVEKHHESRVDDLTRTNLTQEVVGRAHGHYQEVRRLLASPQHTALVRFLESTAPPALSTTSAEDVSTSIFFEKIDTLWEELNEKERQITAALSKEEQRTQLLPGLLSEFYLQAQRLGTLAYMGRELGALPTGQLDASAHIFAESILKSAASLQLGEVISHEAEKALTRQEDRFGYGLLVEATHHLSLYYLWKSEDDNAESGKYHRQLTKACKKLVKKNKKKENAGNGKEKRKKKTKSA